MTSGKTLAPHCALSALFLTSSSEYKRTHTLQTLIVLAYTAYQPMLISTAPVDKVARKTEKQNAAKVVWLLYH